MGVTNSATLHQMFIGIEGTRTREQFIFIV